MNDQAATGPATEQDATPSGVVQRDPVTVVRTYLSHNDPRVRSNAIRALSTIAGK